MQSLLDSNGSGSWRRFGRSLGLATAAAVAVAFGYQTSTVSDAGLMETASFSVAEASAGGSEPLRFPLPIEVETFIVSANGLGTVRSLPLDEDDPRWGPPVERASPAAAPKTEEDIVNAGPAKSNVPEIAPRAPSKVDLSPVVSGPTSRNGETVPTAETAKPIDNQFPGIDIETVIAAAEGFTIPDTVLAASNMARIKSDVRLRARGSNSGRILGVIPGGETVGVIDCRVWCEVTYEGKRGYVYSGFVNGYETRKRRRRAIAAQPAAQEKETPATDEADEGIIPEDSWLRRLFGHGSKPKDETKVSQKE